MIVLSEGPFPGAEPIFSRNGVPILAADTFTMSVKKGLALDRNIWVVKVVKTTTRLQNDGVPHIALQPGLLGKPQHGGSACRTSKPLMVPPRTRFIIS
jgi:hypothetical protein